MIYGDVVRYLGERIINRWRRGFFFSLIYYFGWYSKDACKSNQFKRAVWLGSYLKMVKSKILVLLGLALGLIPIVLGIVALVTSEWLKVGPSTFSLLICNGTEQCPSATEFDTTKGLEIAGVCVTGLAVIFAVLIGLLSKNRWIPLLPVLLLIVGPVLILTGLLLYAKSIFNAVGGYAPESSTTIGYSLILMVVACITGFITSVYFAYVAGSGHSETRNVPTRILVAETAQF